MFFYLLKNSTIIDINISEKERSNKIIIYGCICYIIVHATLFIGGTDALLYSLKPYFWIFLFLDIAVNYINFNNKNMLQNNPTFKEGMKQINSIFDSFLKKKDLDRNITLNTNLPDLKQTKNKDHIKHNPKKKVRFKTTPKHNYNHSSNNLDYSSSSDSDIGTDIDIDSFRESLNNL